MLENRTFGKDFVEAEEIEISSKNHTTTRAKRLKVYYYSGVGSSVERIGSGDFLGDTFCGVVRSIILIKPST